MYIYFGKEINEAAAAELISKLDAKLDGYEAILSKQKYLAGDVRSFSTFVWPF